MTIFDGHGGQIGTNTLLQGVAGWELVSEAVKKDGEELTRLLFKGASEELTPAEEE